MSIGIRPTVDFVFKRLFGNPKHSRIAIQLNHFGQDTLFSQLTSIPYFSTILP